MSNIISFLDNNKDWLFSGLILAVIGWIARYLQSREVDAKLKLVSLDIIEGGSEVKGFWHQWLEKGTSYEDKGFSFPIIDIKVRNTGDAPAFISHMDVEYQCRWAIPYRANFIRHYAKVPFSSVYEILLNPHARVGRSSCYMSQSVYPKDVDRFLIVIKHVERPGEYTYADYQLSLSLRYNERNILHLGKHKLGIRNAEP